MVFFSDLGRCEVSGIPLGKSNRDGGSDDGTIRRWPRLARAVLPSGRHRLHCKSFLSFLPFLPLSLTILYLFYKKTTSISRSRARAELVDQFNPILLKHGLSIVQAVILGAGGRCPRSVIPHLAELLAALVTRLPGECAVWLNAVLSIVRPSSFFFCLFRLLLGRIVLTPPFGGLFEGRVPGS